jgi:hypothetical protein
MLISNSVLVTLNSKNLLLYKNLGYDIPEKPINKNIIIKISDLSKGSKTKVEVICDYCNSLKTVMYKEYNRNISYNNKFSCSNKCAVLKRKELSLIKYGIEDTSSLESTKEKYKKTCIEKYGDYYIKTSEFKYKTKNTLIERYGEDHYSKTEQFKIKIKDTSLKRYGNEYYSKTEEYIERIKQTNINKYGVDNFSKSEERKKLTKIGNHKDYIKYIGNSISLFRCEKNHEYEIHIDNYHNRINRNINLCTICNPIGDLKSIKEKDLYEFISSIYSGEIIQSYRDGLEIDIYLPKLNIGFEFNGSYYHSELYRDKYYHINKTNHFKERGIQIIHIWEDDWDLRKDIIKSQIRNWIGVTENKIYARKCYIKEISKNDLIYFLNENSLEKIDYFTIQIGLFYNEKLVSILCFDDDIIVTSGLLNTNIIGGISKLLKYLSDNYDIKKVISYLNKDCFSGDLYYQLGFKKIEELLPDYKIISNNKIWNCGKLKFEKNI